MYEELETIHKNCLNCHKCILGNTRNNIVFSDGVPNPKLMLIGEAPGFYEDKEGKPFVGKAGQLLDKIFESVGLTRKRDVYICNTVKCRPPENRNPEPNEKEACWEYLKAQIDIIDEKVHGAKLMPIFHPSYLLRNDSREKGSPKWLMWQDIQEIKRKYDEL